MCAHDFALIHSAIIKALHVWDCRLCNPGICVGLQLGEPQVGEVGQSNTLAVRLRRRCTGPLPLTSLVMNDKRRARVLPACVPGAALATTPGAGGFVGAAAPSAGPPLTASPVFGTSGCTQEKANCAFDDTLFRACVWR
eukprot:1095994-Pelagomonas_calceolata.AAC.2